jgi:DNA polymerase-3 subunit gamma/tau
VSNPGFQVIARRWRPRQFDELVGQEHIVRTLKNALTTKQLAHAYLFVGPRGTGKTTTARILAKALNCTGGPKADFSLDDPICQAIEQGSCLDVVEIDAASNRGIDDAKRLREECQYPPNTCTFKVFIIDEVHQLTKDAFNTLLKTFEEPPAWVKFILATTESDKVLPTITSRCQRLEFHPIAEEVISAQLARIVKADGVTAEPAALAAIARLANGGMRDSQSILDQVISFSGKKVTEADVLAIYGLASEQQINGLAQAIATGEATKVLALCDAFHAEGRDLMRVLSDLQLRVRMAVIDAVKANGFSNQWGAAMSTEQLVRILESLQASEQSIRHGLSPRANFEISMLKAIEQSRQRSIDLLIKDIAAAAAGLPREPGQKKISSSLVAPAEVSQATSPVSAPLVSSSSEDSSVLASDSVVDGDERSLVVDDESKSNPDSEIDAFAFNLPTVSVPLSPIDSKPSFPGDKDFEAAVSALPQALRDKLKQTLGAEFTALRSIPSDKLRRPQ